MKLVFLAYINRSGSTFLANQFSKSPNILVCPEADCLADLLLTHPTRTLSPAQKTILIRHLCNDKKFGNWQHACEIASSADYSNTRFNSFADILIRYQKLVKPEASVIIYKAERIFQLIPEISNVNLPGITTHFIALIRDVRAVYYSQTKTRIPETGRKMSKGLINSVQYWNLFVREWKENNQLFSITLHYEELVNHYSSILHDVFAALNENAPDFSSSPGDLFERLQPAHRKIHSDIDNPPKPERIYAWKNELSPLWIKQIEVLASQNMKSMGYSLSNPDVNPVKVYAGIFLRYLIYYFLKKIHYFLYAIKTRKHALK